MKKVVTINLNGRAYQVEEQGFDKLHSYLEGAQKSLAANPDKDEILADIEQAVADKCDTTLTNTKNVVTNESIIDILEKVGPVDASVEPDDKDKLDNDGDVSGTVRKLYLLPKEGKLSGVCAGLAAYFGVDVTIMRLIFVILLFVTQGFMIIVYIALAFAMPAAKKPEEIAAAHGRPVTAMEIVGRVKQAKPSTDTVAKVGEVISLVGKLAAKVFAVCFAALFGLATVLWVWSLWAIGLGMLKLTEQLAVLNGWKQVVIVTAIYVIISIPLYIITQVLDGVSKGAQESATKGQKTIMATSSILLVLTIAIVGLGAFSTAYGTRVTDYVKDHNGYIDIGNHHICVDESKCGNNAAM